MRVGGRLCVLALAISAGGCSLLVSLQGLSDGELYLRMDPADLVLAPGSSGDVTVTVSGASAAVRVSSNATSSVTTSSFVLPSPATMGMGTLTVNISANAPLGD